jgi:adenylate cyclase class IV
MIDFREIEYKYEAKSVELSHFDNFVCSLNPLDVITVSSYDEYYKSSNTDNVDFIRYRYNDYSKELTMKKKTTGINNNNRVEINLKMDEKNDSKIQKFISYMGYEFKFRIYKTSKIYQFDNVIVAYYIVYSENMTEVGRFIELEASEHYNFRDEAHAFSAINNFEKFLEPFGITYRNRLKKSLFEIFCP